MGWQGVGAAVYVQDTAPVGVPAGSFWWQSSTGQLYIYYQDPTGAPQWVFAGSGSPAPPAVIVRSYLAGLTLSTAGSSATFSVAAGQATDSTNLYLMALAAAISKTTGAWVVGNNNGGLDTGAIAINTWYHVHLIQRLDTGVVDVLVSLSATAPTLPANYTIFRRIGSMKTNASSQWIGFIQVGNDFLWTTPVNDVNNINTGTTAALYTLSVPTGLSVKALFHGVFTNTAAGPALYFWSPLVGNPTAVSATYSITCVVAAGASAGDLAVWTDASARIYLQNTTASGNSNYVSTYGWTDMRGRDA